MIIPNAEKIQNHNNMIRWSIIKCKNELKNSIEFKKKVDELIDKITSYYLTLSIANKNQLLSKSTSLKYLINNYEKLIIDELNNRKRVDNVISTYQTVIKKLFKCFIGKNIFA